MARIVLDNLGIEYPNDTGAGGDYINRAPTRKEMAEIGKILKEVLQSDEFVEACMNRVGAIMLDFKIKVG